MAAKTIWVQLGSLITKIEELRDRHVEDFLKADAIYRGYVVARANRLLEDIKNGVPTSELNFPSIMRPRLVSDVYEKKLKVFYSMRAMEYSTVEMDMDEFEIIMNDEFTPIHNKNNIELILEKGEPGVKPS